jgi:hypothetical protein
MLRVFAGACVSEIASDRVHHAPGRHTRKYNALACDVSFVPVAQRLGGLLRTRGKTYETTRDAFRQRYLRALTASSDVTTNIVRDSPGMNCPFGKIASFTTCLVEKRDIQYNHKRGTIPTRPVRQTTTKRENVPNLECGAVRRSCLSDPLFLDQVLGSA